MGDRQWFGVLCTVMGLTVLLYSHYDPTFGPMISTRIEERLGVHHFIAVLIQVAVAIALLLVGLWLIASKRDEGDD